MCHGLPNRLQQSTWPKWFLKESIELPIWFATPRDQNDGKSREHFLHGMGEADPIAVRHLHIANDHIHGISKFLHNLKSTNTIFSLHSLKMLPL